MSMYKNDSWCILILTKLNKSTLSLTEKGSSRILCLIAAAVALAVAAEAIGATAGRLQARIAAEGMGLHACVGGCGRSRHDGATQDRQRAQAGWGGCGCAHRVRPEERGHGAVSAGNGSSGVADA